MGFVMGSTWLEHNSSLQDILKPLKPQLLHKDSLEKKKLQTLSVLTPFAFSIITLSCLHPFLPSLRPSGSPVWGFGEKEIKVTAEGDQTSSFRIHKPNNLAPAALLEVIIQPLAAFIGVTPPVLWKIKCLACPEQIESSRAPSSVRWGNTSGIVAEMKETQMNAQLFKLSASGFSSCPDIT